MSIRITLSNAVEAEGLPQPLRNEIIHDLTLPNPAFVTRQRMGKWLDETPETLCLVAQHSEILKLPRGYIESLLSRIRGAGLEYTLEDRRLTLTPLDLAFNGTLHVYQRVTLEIMSRHGSGLLIAPCGSGKTVLGMAIIHQRRQPALVLVHTRELVRQTCEAIRHWLEIEPGVISEGVCNPAPVSVAMVQTLSAHPEYVGAIQNSFGLVLLDEAHHCPAVTFTDIMQAFPAAYRYGLTATPKRRDGLSPFMEAVIGPVRHTITAADLRKAGLLVTPRIEWVRTDFSTCASEWVDILSDLTKNEARNQLALKVIERALNEGRKVICLSERVAHVELLAGLLKERRPGTVALITGTMSKKKREAAMEWMKNGEARILFATKLADEGLNLPDLDTLVLLTPSRDGGRTTQRVGRTLRAVPGKPAPVVFDLVDADVGLLRSQARTRFFECYRFLAPGIRLPEWLDSKKRAAQRGGTAA